MQIIASANTDTLQPASQLSGNPGNPSAKISAKRGEIRPLTSLRFFAALAILLYHGGEQFTCLKGLHNTYIAEQAVTFFFVLSGFILTYNYAAITGFRSTVNFYLARFSRIWPAHAATLFLLVFLIPEVFKVKHGDWELFLRNLFLLQSWGIPSSHSYFSYNASAWSISTEMFFYFCFPFLLMVMNKKWYGPIAITASIVGLLICYSNYVNLPESDPLGLSYQGLLFISPLSSILSFAFGMTAAFLWRKNSPHLHLNSIVATFLEVTILASICFINVHSSAFRCALAPWIGAGGAFWVQNAGSSILAFALLVTIFACDKGWISKLFSNPILVLLGELSFGIYLLHGVLITFVQINFPQAQSDIACLTFLLVLLISTHLLYEIVEKPVRKIMVSKGLIVLDYIQDKLKLAFPAKGHSFSSQSRSDASLSKNSTLDHKVTAPKLIMSPRLILEGILFAVLIYSSLPTIQQLTSAEAAELTKEAVPRNIILSPYLVCRSTSARVSHEAISMKILWESLKSGSVNFVVKAVAIDKSGNELGSTTYTQDGRRQFVKQGVCWIDQPKISLNANAAPASVNIMVLRNKHVLLHSTDSKADSVSFTIPLLTAN